MLIPFNTTAPIYHRPIATIATIVLNVLVFLPIGLAADPEKLPLYPYLVLQHGYWWPWQWVTSNYVHGTWMHLLGNMFVLWGFGLVVEGKIGWWRFLLLYNGIGIVQCAFEQTLALTLGEGASCGASSIVYGLIAIAVVWAPANEMSCFYCFGWRLNGIAELSIPTFAGISFCLQIALSFFVVVKASQGEGFEFTSQVLHVMGGLVGLVVGVVMVKWKLVDCEGWDIFSVWAGRHNRTIGEEAVDVANELEKIKRQEKAKYQLEPNSQPPVVRPNRATTSPRPAPNFDEPSPDAEGFLEQFQNQLEANQPLAAFAIHQRAVQQFPGWRVSEPEYVQLITQLRNQKISEPLIPVMLGYLRRYSERTTTVRLALAQLLVQLQRPKQSLAVLQRVAVASLDPKQRQSLTQLRAAASQLAAQGIHEPPPQDW